MTVADMHILFRQFAQQMGMQNVRGILPEQIDLLLNTSIIDTVNNIIKENITITHDKVIADSAKLNQINALKPLYKYEENDIIENDNIEFKNADYVDGKFTIDLSNIVNDYLYLVNLSVNYSVVAENSNNGWKVDENDDLVKPTISEQGNYNNIPVRVIDESDLSNTLHDYILKPTIKSPISIIANNKADIYFGKMIPFEDISKGYVLKHNLTPSIVRISYIDKPLTVKYDPNGISINCNLPEYLHHDIVKHAADLYKLSVNGSSMNQPQQQPVYPNTQYQQNQ